MMTHFPFSQTAISILTSTFPHFSLLNFPSMILQSPFVLTYFPPTFLPYCPLLPTISFHSPPLICPRFRSSPRLISHHLPLFPAPHFPSLPIPWIPFTSPLLRTILVLPVFHLISPNFTSLIYTTPPLSPNFYYFLSFPITSHTSPHLTFLYLPLLLSPHFLFLLTPHFPSFFIFSLFSFLLTSPTSLPPLNILPLLTLYPLSPDFPLLPLFRLFSLPSSFVCQTFFMAGKVMGIRGSVVRGEYSK